MAFTWQEFERQAQKQALSWAWLKQAFARQQARQPMQVQGLLNQGCCRPHWAGPSQEAMCALASCLSLWDANCQSKPTPRCRQKIPPPMQPWFETKSWPLRWHQTNCPNCHCQTPRPCQRPCRAGQESVRSCQALTALGPTAKDLVAYSCELRKSHVDAAATMDKKSTAFKEAPPIKPPSISFCASKLAALAAFMLPPYNKGMRCDCSVAALSCARSNA